MFVYATLHAGGIGCKVDLKEERDTLWLRVFYQGSPALYLAFQLDDMADVVALQRIVSHLQRFAEKRAAALADAECIAEAILEEGG